MSKRPNVPHVVYLCRDAGGAIIYVGATSHLSNRKSRHRKASAWWPLAASCEVESYHPDWDSAHRRERFLIATEEPTYNVKHNPRGNEDERAYQLAMARPASPSSEPIEDVIEAMYARVVGVTASAT